MKIIWREMALDSLERARAYIAQDDPAAVARVRESILGAVRTLADMPNRGRPGRVEDTRELVVSGTTYIVAYTVLHNQIMILAVQHGAQEWPDRF
jgi:toxin ParE1/3/4